MVWTLQPPPRADLIIENEFLADGDGNYVGDWVDTAGIDSIRFAVTTQNSDGTYVYIEEGFVIPGVDLDGGPASINNQSFALSGGRYQGTFALTGHYFRVKFEGVTASTYVNVVVRSVS